MKKVILAVALIAFGTSAAFAAEKCCCDKMKAAHHSTMHHK
jgi:hypothetical protein